MAAKFQLLVAAALASSVSCQHLLGALDHTVKADEKNEADDAFNAGFLLHGVQPHAQAPAFVKPHAPLAPKVVVPVAKFVAKAAPVVAKHTSDSFADTILQDASDSKSLTTVELEMAVTELMLGGATPMGDTTKKIQDLIEKQMLPKILEAHTADQNQLDKLAKAVAACKTTKDTTLTTASTKTVVYKSKSPLHKTCRVTEAEMLTSKITCEEELKDKKTVKQLRCSAFVSYGKKWADGSRNQGIVQRGNGEAEETYLRRISQTWCKPGDVLETYLIHKTKCDLATKDVAKKEKECAQKSKQWKEKKQECNNIQKQMDESSCGAAIITKDACETFAECYKDKKEAYTVSEKMVKVQEKARQNEWRATKRMQCLIVAFKDGKVEDSEVKLCKDKTHSTNHLVINYPKIKDMEMCAVPALYPYTAEYKLREFTPLPALAKGDMEANECNGIREVSTTPAKGSPTTCKCDRVTMNGPWSAGALLMCSDCTDVRRTGDKNSCPDGTKLFSPRSRQDWATLLASAKPLRAPNWIIDVTRPQNGCGGCTGNTFNSGNSKQSSWVTSDKSPWWLRDSKYNEPNGDYHANCYLDLWHTPKNENEVTWNDGNCNYHSKSYYCQPTAISTTPKAGSPSGCTCVKVALTGTYTPGVLMKCTACLDVYKSTQKNSCPSGTKIFAPRSRDDWQTFINSAGPLRSPHWIIDVTRPQNGCGGCTGHAMNSALAAQATWRTADGAPWWLRSTRYNEPNGDYHANCYLDLWHNPANADGVTWNDGNCNYHANGYYCQQAKR